MVQLVRIQMVEAGGQSFTDVPQNCFTLVNLASVRELETRGDVVLPPASTRPHSWLGHWMRFLGFLARSAPIVLGRR